jgi:hypothetical protein
VLSKKYRYTKCQRPKVKHKEVCGQMAVLCDCRTCSGVRIHILTNEVCFISSHFPLQQFIGKINNSPIMKQKALRGLVATVATMGLRS